MENDLNCHAVKIDLKQGKHQGTNSCYNQVNGTSGAGLVIAFVTYQFDDLFSEMEKNNGNFLIPY